MPATCDRPAHLLARGELMAEIATTVGLIAETDSVLTWRGASPAMLGLMAERRVALVVTMRELEAILADMG